MQAPLAALQFSGSDCGQFAQLTAENWKHILRFCDRSQLTLPLALRARDHLPVEIRARTDRNLAGNAERWTRIRAAYHEVAEAFERAGIEFAVLKGFSHCPDFIPDPRWRPQYDLDLLLPEAQLARARDVATWLGFEPIERSNGRVDHLPAMVRKTGWEWRGDLFDPEIPISLELHFRLWDEHTEHFAPTGLEQFWERRECRILEDLSFTALHPVDAVAYSSLHLLRHLLRGDAKPFHVYELASNLHRSAKCEHFWSQWSEWHDPQLRQLEAICFELARRWFACQLSPAALEEIARLPPDVRRWMDLSAFSPLAALEHPNKDELWLHWSLIDSRPASWAMLRRRLLPAKPPGPVDAVHIPDREMTLRIAVRRRWRYAKHMASRLAHHVTALPGVAVSALRWFT